MGKNKKEKKEDKFIEKIVEKIKYDWAKKRGKGYPFNPADYLQFELETHIQNCFWKLKKMFIKGNELEMTTEPMPRSFITTNPWSNWKYDDIGEDAKQQYRLIPEEDMNRLICVIRDVFNEDEGFATPKKQRYTVLNLFCKYQDACYDDGEDSYQFNRASVMVSASHNNPKYLYVGSNEGIDATLYSGWYNETDRSDEDYNAFDDRRIGFLVFNDKDNKDHAFELEEFSALVETLESSLKGRKYIFTFFNRAKDIFCALILPELDNVEFLLENGEVKVVKNNELQPPEYSENKLENIDSYKLIRTLYKNDKFCIAENKKQYNDEPQKYDGLIHNELLYLRGENLLNRFKSMGYPNTFADIRSSLIANNALKLDCEGRNCKIDNARFYGIYLNKLN